MIDGITYRNVTAHNVDEMISVNLNYHTGLKPTNKTATPVMKNVLIENCKFIGGDNAGDNAGGADGDGDDHSNASSSSCSV